MTGSLDALSLRAVRPEDWTTIHEWAGREDGSRYQSRFVLAAVTTEDEVRGLAEVNVRDRRWRIADIGYAVHHHHRRRGYGTRIARLVVDFAFAELGMHRVEATCYPRNAGSAAILRRLGMSHEGTMRHTMELEDGWRDSELFSVIEHEWVRVAQPD